ncbi:MAG: hypothetical protein OER85_05250 [Gammaproteobacteria bacterium]|nr:hypothetical protein [Gammaproteobacteria bacterium]
MTRTNKLALLVLAAAVTMISGCERPDSAADAEQAAPPAPAADTTATDEVARGREQLIRAFDAAWIRFIARGGIDDVLATEPPNQPGLAASYVVRMADCLPSPELAAFPENPVGMFKEILDSGKIRQIGQNVPNTPGDTSYYFSGISAKYLKGILAEIGAHYGVEITVENVLFPPGKLPATSALLNDEADYVGQLNATGGVSQGMRRRISRRFTCTMSASSQFIHIPKTSELAAEIDTWKDLASRPELRICAGPLTTQTARAFLPKHSVKTVYINDLPICVERIESGKSDLIINPLPSLTIAGIDGYESVPTNIVAGTPLWVALEGIECPSDGDPKTEDACLEIEPP